VNVGKCKPTGAWGHLSGARPPMSTHHKETPTDGSTAPISDDTHIGTALLADADVRVTIDAQRLRAAALLDVDEGDGRFTGEVAHGHLDHDADLKTTVTTHPVGTLEAVPVSITTDTANGHSVTATDALTAEQAEALAAAPQTSE
jgi:hypothetical protein